MDTQGDFYDASPWGDRGLCCLIETQRGDPPSSIHIGKDIVLLGTMLGQLIGFSFNVENTNNISPAVARASRSDGNVNHVIIDTNNIDKRDCTTTVHDANKDSLPCPKSDEIAAKGENISKQDFQVPTDECGKGVSSSQAVTPRVADCSLQADHTQTAGDCVDAKCHDVAVKDGRFTGVDEDEMFAQQTDKTRQSSCETQNDSGKENQNGDSSKPGRSLPPNVPSIGSSGHPESITGPSKLTVVANSVAAGIGWLFGMRSTDSGGGGSVRRPRLPPVIKGLCRPPGGYFRLFAAYADDGIKVLHADESKVFAVIGNSQCRTWQRVSPDVQGGFQFDSHITSVHKYALGGYNSPLALIVTSGVTVLVNQKDETQLLFPFKLPDKEIVPLDFHAKKLYMLLFFHRADDLPCVKVFRLPTNIQRPLWGRVLHPIFQHNLPNAKLITQIKFWGDDRVVITWQGRFATVHQIQPTNPFGTILFTLNGHSDDIVAVNGTRPERLLTLGKDEKLNVWNFTGELVFTYDIRPATFRIGFPYLMCQDADDANRIVFSSDSGLYLLDLSLAFGRIMFAKR